MKVGKEHFRQEQDGSFTELEPTFHNLVAFKAAAEQGHARLSKGDRFIAEGFVRQYTYERDGQTIEGEEFTARRIGHDMARTRYRGRPHTAEGRQPNVKRLLAMHQHSNFQPSHAPAVPHPVWGSEATNMSDYNIEPDEIDVGALGEDSFRCSLRAPTPSELELS